MMPVNCFVIKKHDILTLASLYSNTHKKKRKGENKLVYTFYELCWFFLIYSFAGWCAGVVANAVRNRKFVNTGFMNMPFCLSYGVCAVLCCIFLPELRHRIFFLFIGGALLAAFVSIMTGLILEHIFHRKWRDYSEQRFGIGGFMTAPLLLLYGAGAVVELYFGNGLILSLVHLIPHFIGKIILIVVGVLFAADLSGTLAVVWKWRRHVNRMAAWTDGMQQMTDTFGNAITRMIRKRLEKTYPNIRTEELVAAKQKEEAPEAACFAAGCSLYKLIWLFLIGAFLGDIVETIFCRITMGYWMSRSSVVYGPFSVVWGLACALLTAFLYKYKDKSDRYIFAYGTIVGGAYEYLCSVFTELLFGTTFWDYSDIPFNLGGRINLLYCFFWGIAAVVWLKGIYPLFSDWIEKIPKKIGPVLTWIAVVLMIANITISALALARYSARQTGAAPTNAIEQQLDEHFPDSRMQRIYPKAKFV